MYDTLLYTKKLEAAGFPREQAEAQVHILTEMIVDGVATKKDLEIQNVLTSKEFAAVRSEMASEFAKVRNEMQTGFKNLELRMTIQFVTMLATGISIVISIFSIAR